MGRSVSPATVVFRSVTGFVSQRRVWKERVGGCSRHVVSSAYGRLDLVRSHVVVFAARGR